MNTLSYDVVIIGGGPAGMAAALASRKQGAKTLILERYEREQKPQTNSPLDSLFITYGRTVTSPKDIHTSYEEALLH